MALYSELRECSESLDLLIKVQVACIISANIIADEATDVLFHSQRLLWANSAYNDPVATAKKMVWAVLAKNAAATKAQILAATDATVQTNVNAAVNVFAITMV